MNASTVAIPQITLETVAKSFFKEMSNYGFRQLDYLRFVNLLLDLSMKQVRTGDRERGAKRGENHES